MILRSNYNKFLSTSSSLMRPRKKRFIRTDLSPRRSSFEILLISPSNLSKRDLSFCLSSSVHFTRLFFLNLIWEIFPFKFFRPLQIVFINQIQKLKFHMDRFFIISILFRNLNKVSILWDTGLYHFCNLVIGLEFTNVWKPSLRMWGQSWSASLFSMKMEPFCSSKWHSTVLL